MTPKRFSMMISAMLIAAFQDSYMYTGFPIRCRFDGNIFNLTRLQAKTKVQTDVLDEILCADDMNKNISSEIKSKGPWLKFHNHVIYMYIAYGQIVVNI